MDTVVFEGLAIATYTRFGLSPDEPASIFKIIRLLLGPGAVVRSSLKSVGAATFKVNGVQKIALHPKLPLPSARFCGAHETSHILLAEQGYNEPDIEACCDYLGACLMAPRPAVHRMRRAFGDDFAAMADSVGATETWAALRVGEALGVNLAAISPAQIRVRGQTEFVWPGEDELRRIAKRGRPGIRRVKLTDDRRRTVLLAEDIDAA
jgi:hypothetical protein